MSKASAEQAPEIAPIQQSLGASGVASTAPRMDASGKASDKPESTDASLANPRATPGRMPLFRR